MIKRYQRNLIEFAYPENWQLVAPDDDYLPKEISLESPDGCFWVLHAFGKDRDSGELMAEVIKTFEANYEDFEYEPVPTDLEPAPSEAIQADFFCLDFLVTARMMLFEHQSLTYIVIQQAERRQFDKMALVFDAITTSLIGTLPAQDIDP